MGKGDERRTGRDRRNIAPPHTTRSNVVAFSQPPVPVNKPPRTPSAVDAKLRRLARYAVI